MFHLTVVLVLLLVSLLVDACLVTVSAIAGATVCFT